MISWKEACALAEKERPDLNDHERRIVARIIFHRRNIVENLVLSIIISMAAIVISLLALFK